MYLLILIFVLIILLQLNISNNLVLLLLLITLAQVITKDFVYTLLISLPIFTILYFMKRNNEKFSENFEDNDEEETNNKKLKEKKTHDKETIKKVKHLKNIINKLENGLSITDDDMIEKNNIKDHDFDSNIETEDDIINMRNKDTKDFTPNEAQKQTYQLIDTVKQLNSTIKTLAPTLEMGRKVMDQMNLKPKFEFTKEREGDHLRRCPNIMKLLDYTGGYNFLSLEDGLKRTIKYYKDKKNS